MSVLRLSGLAHAGLRVGDQGVQGVCSTAPLLVAALVAITVAFRVLIINWSSRVLSVRASAAMATLSRVALPVSAGATVTGTAARPSTPNAVPVVATTLGSAPRPASTDVGEKSMSSVGIRAAVTLRATG